MYDEVIDTRGEYRVRVTYMEGMENPRTDGDYHLAGVVTLYGGNYIDVADPAGDLRVSDAWTRLEYRYGWRTAMPMLCRYITLLGGVSELDTPHDGPVSLWYLTPEMWASENGPAGEWDADRAREYVTNECNEYRAWAAGETYGIVVEKRVRWIKEGTDTYLADEVETMDTWEEEESVWGFIGDDYAESEAREMLNNYAPESGSK